MIFGPGRTSTETLTELVRELQGGLVCFGRTRLHWIGVTKETIGQDTRDPIDRVNQLRSEGTLGGVIRCTGTRAKRASATYLDDWSPQARISERQLSSPS